MNKLIYALLIFVSACTASPVTSLTEADNGKTIYTTVGQEISIILTGNATTGYNWQFSSDKPAHSKVIKDAYIVEKHPTGMVGVGGKNIYQITKQIITWHYQRQ